MDTQPAGGVARQLRRLTAAIDPDGPTDGALLNRFLADRDQEAFALLVRRHGPMVLGVCRRVAGHRDDADDAFQAAFLVLARKAAGLADRGTVGGWLHGVAFRTALKARARAARRRVKEAAAARPEAVTDPCRDELPGVIDREVAGLPVKYREALVLCEIEGRPRREAAAALNIPEGTLSSRLAAAKQMLAGRLARRGYGPLAGLPLTPLVTAALAESATRAAAGSASPAVLALAKSRSQVMAVTQWAAGLAAAVVALAAAFGPARGTPANPSPTPATAEDKPAEGVYVLKFEGTGRKVKLADGSDAVLGRRLSPSVGVGGTLRSNSNDNSRFRLTIDKLGPLPPEVTDEQTALVVDGLVFHLGRPDKLPADGVVGTWANVYSAEAARALAARYRIEPQLRKHPGHRYAVRWVPDKPAYTAGEPVRLTMELTNTGAGPLRFSFGGKQRGPRNNQFRFIAQAGWGGKGLPDTGDPTNFGGKSRSKTLRPGEAFTAEVDLSKWFTFAEPNVYRITGVFEMPVIDPASPDGFDPVLWDDLAAGECDVRVVARAK